MDETCDSLEVSFNRYLLSVVQGCIPYRAWATPIARKASLIHWEMSLAFVQLLVDNVSDDTLGNAANDDW